MVSSKIHFSNNEKDLEQYIPYDHIVKELNGGDNYEYKYIEPQPDENKLMEDTSTRDSLLAKQKELTDSLEKSTIEWVFAGYKGNKDAKEAANKDRKDTIKKMESLYWELDPYIRARSLYDRLGVIQPGGKIDFYPEKSKSA